LQARGLTVFASCSSRVPPEIILCVPFPLAAGPGVHAGQLHATDRRGDGAADEAIEPVVVGARGFQLPFLHVAAVAVGEGPGLGAGDVLGEERVFARGLAEERERPRIAGRARAGKSWCRPVLGTLPRLARCGMGNPPGLPPAAKPGQPSGDSPWRQPFMGLQKCRRGNFRQTPHLAHPMVVPPFFRTFGRGFGESPLSLSDILKCITAGGQNRSTGLRRYQIPIKRDQKVSKTVKKGGYPSYQKSKKRPWR